MEVAISVDPVRPTTKEAKISERLNVGIRK